MRMETRTKTVKEEVYIANDGTVFKSSADCYAYEDKINKDKRKRIDYKRIEELDGWYPYDEYTNSDTHDYYWYNIETEEELDLLNEAYEFYPSECDVILPEIICVDIPDYERDCYWSTLSSMKKTLNEFFKIVGYEIVKERY